VPLGDVHSASQWKTGGVVQVLVGGGGGSLEVTWGGSLGFFLSRKWGMV